MSYFIKKQVKDIYYGGFPTLFNKLKLAFFLLEPHSVATPFLILASIPIVIIVRLLVPIIHVRFGYFTVERLGHFVFDVEYYFTEKALKNSQMSYYDIFFFSGQPANEFYSKMTKRNVLFLNLIRFPFWVNSLLPGYKKHQVIPARRIPGIGSKDIHGYFRKIPTQLSFNKREDIEGNSFLKSVGMNPKDKFVCLMVRDSEYLKKEPHLKTKNWSYHDYRDSNIENFTTSVDYLVNKGYFVFRMGKIVKSKLNFNHPKFLDYANSNYKSPFLDIWLTTNCFFAVTSTFGLSNLAMAFRRPCALIDAMPLGTIDAITNENHMWLPKKIQFKKNNSFLSLYQQIETGAIGFLRTEDYHNKGLEILDNTPEEILETVVEIEQKLTGAWQVKDNDIEFQNKYWEILKTWKLFSKYHGEILEKLPDTFLRKNHQWFLK